MPSDRRLIGEATLVEPFIPPSLTAREQQVAELIQQGLTDREIADRLEISHWTVNTYTKTLFRKLGIRRRSAVGRALPAVIGQEAAA